MIILFPFCFPFLNKSYGLSQKQRKGRREGGREEEAGEERKGKERRKGRKSRMRGDENEMIRNTWQRKLRPVTGTEAQTDPQHTQRGVGSSESNDVY